MSELLHIDDSEVFKEAMRDGYLAKQFLQSDRVILSQGAKAYILQNDIVSQPLARYFSSKEDRELNSGNMGLFSAFTDQTAIANYVLDDKEYRDPAYSILLDLVPDFQERVTLGQYAAISCYYTRRWECLWRHSAFESLSDVLWSYQWKSVSVTKRDMPLWRVWYDRLREQGLTGWLTQDFFTAVYSMGLNNLPRDLLVQSILTDLSDLREQHCVPVETVERVVSNMLSQKVNSPACLAPMLAVIDRYRKDDMQSSDFKVAYFELVCIPIIQRTLYSCLSDVHRAERMYGKSFRSSEMYKINASVAASIYSEFRTELFALDGKRKLFAQWSTELLLEVFGDVLIEDYDLTQMTLGQKLSAKHQVALVAKDWRCITLFANPSKTALKLARELGGEPACILVDILNQR